MDNVFPNNDEDGVNLSLRDNQAAVLSMRSRNINLCSKKDDNFKVSKVDRKDSMIRNLVSLDNVQVYKSTPSYEQIKLNSDSSVSNILDFASAIEQIQNMQKISVPAVSRVSTDIREY